MFSKKMRREQMHRSAGLYHKTGNAEHLLDITRIAVYSRNEAILIEWWDWAKEKIRMAVRINK